MDAKSEPAALSTGIDCRNALVTRIALFLNYLSKSDYQKLVRDLMNRDIASEGEILRHMLEQKFVAPDELQHLKKTCLNFAKDQEDTRFGSLCIQFEFLTQSNLDLALEEQKTLSQNGSSIFLGDLLVDAGMLSERQRKLILQKQKMETTLREPKSAQKRESLREIREGGLTFLITHDGLKAFLVKTDQFDTEMELADLKDLIEKNGIIYGVETDDALTAFLKTDARKMDQFTVAKGLPPMDGMDGKISYLFEQDFLKAGQLGEDGSIDYRDRGEIPHIKKGDILAEKIVPKTGRDGVNIYGDAVPPNPPIDPPLTCGKGARLSEDGLQIMADRDGYPRLNRQGEVAVNEAYFIKGDVDYTTGHIKFEKSVFITGTIKSGFKVSAIDVVAKAVDGGTIQAKGDVCVKQGITDAAITVGGNLAAGFIHASEITCMGDMIVNKELVDTRVVMEGTFKMLRGRMYASTLYARGGARIWHVGSEKARPCNITVGTSHYLRKMLDSVDKRIEKQQTAYEMKRDEKTRAEKSLDQVDMLMDKLETHKSESVDNDKMMLQARKTALERKIRKLSREIDLFDAAIKKSVQEKFNLKKHGRDTPPKPILDVQGKLLSGTQINGRFSQRIISSDLFRARIMEISCRDEQNRQNNWEMVATRL